MLWIEESTVIGSVMKYDVTMGDISGAYSVVNTEILGALRKLADQVSAGDIADPLTTLRAVPALVSVLVLGVKEDD